MDHPGLSIVSLPPAAALASLGSSHNGLAAGEAQRRLAEFGVNEVAAVTADPLWLMLAREFTHFFALILWLAAGLAFFAAHAEPGQGMFELGLAIVGVIVVNGCFSFWQAYRAERALSALQKLLPQQVDVRRDGTALVIPASALVPGDLVQLAEGAKVPADCRVVESWGLRVNLATLTGEPYARSISAEARAADNATAAPNLLFAGTLIITGECTAVVYATGMHTEFGRIAHLTQTAGETESPLQKEIRRVSHHRGPARPRPRGHLLRHRPVRRPARSGPTSSSPSASSSPTSRRGCCRLSRWRSPWPPSAWPGATRWCGICRRWKRWAAPPSS